VKFYIIRASNLLGREDRVQSRAILDCKAGSNQILLDERVLHEVPILFAKRILEGETCFFATRLLG
jgi:hypothetical protein